MICPFCKKRTSKYDLALHIMNEVTTVKAPNNYTLHDIHVRAISILADKIVELLKR